MSRESFVFVLGFLVFLAPFMGLPRSIKDILLLVIGGLLMLVGFILRRSAYMRSTLRESGERESDAFAESSALAASERELSAQEPVQNL